MNQYLMSIFLFLKPGIVYSSCKAKKKHRLAPMLFIMLCVLFSKNGTLNIMLQLGCLVHNQIFYRPVS